MQQLSCGCEGSVARCAKGLALLDRKTNRAQEWERTIAAADWKGERLARPGYYQAVAALIRHLRGQDGPPTGRYMVFLDLGDDGYTAHDWSLVGRADSIEGLTKHYAHALRSASGWKERGSQVLVVEEVKVDVLQVLQIAIRETA